MTTALTVDQIQDVLDGPSFDNLTEREEGEVLALKETVVRALGVDGAVSLVVRLALKDEAYLRATQPADAPILRALDEYHERRRLGL